MRWLIELGILLSSLWAAYLVMLIVMFYVDGWNSMAPY